LGASDISAREYPSGDGVDGRLLVFNIRPLHVLTAKKKKKTKKDNSLQRKMATTKREKEKTNKEKRQTVQKFDQA